jgi:hypothetical protein
MLDSKLSKLGHHGGGELLEFYELRPVFMCLNVIALSCWGGIYRTCDVLIVGMFFIRHGSVWVAFEPCQYLIA